MRVYSSISLSIFQFSPSRHIAMKHEAYETEKESKILRPFIYRNSWNEGEVSEPLFPLEETLMVDLIKNGVSKVQSRVT